MVDAAFLYIGGVVLIVSLIMTGAFFTLNSNLEDENRRLRERLDEFEKSSKK